MDQHKLRNLVFEKTGVRVDTDDPIFALVALNEAVLAEAVERHVALLDEATRELGLQARALHDAGLLRAAPAPGPALRKASKAVISEFEASDPEPAGAEDEAEADPAPPAPAPAPAAAPLDQRLLGLAGAVALLTALLVLAGQALFHRPAAAPAVLSAEQTNALARAEKLTKALDKLDDKSRALIQAELQKP